MSSPEASGAAWAGVIVGALGVIVGVRAIGVAKRIARTQEAHRELAYSATSTPIYSVHLDMGKRLQMLVDGAVVHNPQLTTIRFANTGNQPISVTDFARPITIFPTTSDARVLGADVATTSPESLGAQLVRGSQGNPAAANTFHIPPLLLNPGDSIDVRVLLDGPKPVFGIDARVVGVPELKSLGPLDAGKGASKS